MLAPEAFETRTIKTDVDGPVTATKNPETRAFGLWADLYPTRNLLKKNLGIDDYILLVASFGSPLCATPSLSDLLWFDR